MCVRVRERMGKEETYGIFDSDGLSVSLPGCLTGRPGWFGLDWTGLDWTKLGWAGLGWAELGWGWEWNGMDSSCDIERTREGERERKKNSIQLLSL